MNKRRIMFVAGTLLATVAICVLCFIIGRGHTLYFDNKSIENTNYSSYNAIDLVYKGEKVTTLAARERSSISFTGQSVTVTLGVKKSKTSSVEEKTVTFKVPYNMDGIVINLPAYLDGADESVYMSEFVSMAIVDETSADDEVPVTDEFAIEGADEEQQ